VPTHDTECYGVMCLHGMTGEMYPVPAFQGTSCTCASGTYRAWLGRYVTVEANTTWGDNTQITLDQV